MPGVPQVTKENHSYTPVSGATVVGGRVCQANGSRIEHAAAGSTKALGVAITDAMSPEAFNNAPTLVNGRPTLTAAVLPTRVALVYGGTETVVEYAADAAFGDPLICAADGKVTPAGATPDARTIVARCTQPGGVTVATKTTGLARIL